MVNQPGHAMRFHFAHLVIALLVSITALLSAAETGAAKTYPPQMDGAKVETYKTVAGTELKLWIFSPPSAPSSVPRAAPAIVFFFGGGWTSGSPQQFEAQCRHFASRGMVAIAADYRVKSRQDAKPVQCIADARSAVRWVRAHAATLGIDPQRIASAGGSAGGHLAASTAFISDFDEANEDKSVSAVPGRLHYSPGDTAANFMSWHSPSML